MKEGGITDTAVETDLKALATLATFFQLKEASFLRRYRSSRGVLYKLYRSSRGVIEESQKIPRGLLRDCY